MTFPTQAREALETLKAGNARFVSGDRREQPVATQRTDTAGGQQPFAIILGCADSRVPAELVFDQGIGDLFVVRVAGNIATPAQIGSVEFAASQFGSPLVVVLGHSSCGAIKATITEVRSGSASASEHLATIVDSIRPAVTPLINQHDDEEALVHAAMRANVAASAALLRRESDILSGLIAAGTLRIIGADYDLASGKVHFFDGLD